MKKLFNLRNIAQAAVLGLGLPMAAFAQGTAIDNILVQIGNTLNIVLVLLFAIITIYFIWGVIQYVTAGGDDEKLAKGKQHMLWGIIGLAVVAGAWGISQLILNYLGVSGGTTTDIPQF